MRRNLKGYSEEFQRENLTLIEQVNKAYECFLAGKPYVLNCEFDTMDFFRHSSLFKAKLSPEFIMYLERPSRGRHRNFDFRMIPPRFKTDELCEFFVFKKDASPDRLPKHLAESYEFAVRATKHKPRNRSSFPAFNKDVELVRLANVPGNEFVLYQVHSSIETNKELILELVKTNPNVLINLHSSLRKNKDFIWACYKANPQCKEYAFRYFESLSGVAQKKAVASFIAEREKIDIGNIISPRGESEQEARARRKIQSGM